MRALLLLKIKIKLRLHQIIMSKFLNTLETENETLLFYIYDRVFQKMKLISQIYDKSLIIFTVKSIVNVKR